MSVVFSKPSFFVFWSLCKVPDISLKPFWIRSVISLSLYKLESNDETFDAIANNSSQIFIKRGFCRSLYVAADNAKLNEKQEKVINHILDKCDKKYLGKLGVRNF